MRAEPSMIWGMLIDWLKLPGDSLLYLDTEGGVLAGSKRGDPSQQLPGGLIGHSFIDLVGAHAAGPALPVEEVWKELKTEGIWEGRVGVPGSALLDIMLVRSGSLAKEQAFLARVSLHSDMARRESSRKGVNLPLPGGEGDNHLELIFHSLTQGMMITDLEGRVLKVNTAIYERMRQKPEDRIGKFFWDSHEWLAKPESVGRVKVDFERVASGESMTGIYATAPFGELVHLKLQMHPIFGTDGHIKYVTIEGTPFTKEYQAQQDLELQRGIIRGFMENVPLPIWVIDLKGALILMNDAYAEFYGLTQSDIGKNIYARRSEKISEQCIRNNQQVFKSGVPLHSVEYVKDSRGTTRIFHVTKFPISSPNGDHLVGGVSLEMTDKIVTDQKLNKALARFESVSEATNDLIYEYDIATGKVTISGNAFGIFDDRKERELHMSELLAYMHPADKEKQLKRQEKAIKNRERSDWQAEFKIRDRDGNYFPVMDRAIIYRDGTGFAHRVVGSIQDMRELYRLNAVLAESQLQAYRNSQRVSFEAAERERNLIAEELHDRVNPLLAAAKLHIGMSETGTGDVQEFLTQGKFLILEAVDAIRNLSHRISHVMMKDRRLDEIIEGFLKRLHAGEEVPEIKVTSRKMEVVQDLYFKMNVLRILQEQFENAVKHAKAGHFDVDLYTRQGVLFLQIKDDGVGFDPKVEKSGLGFTEIASRVEAYGGKLKITSAPGKGCKLDIQIPIENL